MKKSAFSLRARKVLWLLSLLAGCESSAEFDERSWFNTNIAEACEERMRGLEDRVHALEEQLKLSLDRELHLANLLNLVVHPSLAEQGSAVAELGNGALPAPLNMSSACPFGSMAVKTRSSPSHFICVHVAPHLVDATISTAGSWGDGQELRNWIMLLGWMARGHGLEVRKQFQNLTVVDVGAHIGTASIFLAMLRDYQFFELDRVQDWDPHLHLVLPDLNIVAIEPDVAHASMINASARLNKIEDRILIIVKAAYNRSGSPIAYHRYDNLNSGCSHLTTARSTQELTSDAASRLEAKLLQGVPHRSLDVETIALDDLFVNAEQFIVLKVDVEQTESQVLQGAGRLLDEERIMLVHSEVRANLDSSGDASIFVLHFLLKRGFIWLCGGACAEHVPTFAWQLVTAENVKPFVENLRHHHTDLVAFHRRILRTELFGLDLKEAYALAHRMWATGTFQARDPTGASSSRS